MQLKVVHIKPDGEEDSSNQKVFYVDRREDTYESFFDMVYTEFSKDLSEGKVRENFRLRAYNV